MIIQALSFVNALYFVRDFAEIDMDLLNVLQVAIVLSA